MEQFFTALVGALSLSSLGLSLVGVVFGLILGIIPGLTATLAVILLLPATYGMTPADGMTLLLGAYVGGISGGVVAAVLLGMPGTPSSITSVFDGYPMAMKGQGGKALGIGAVSNLLGTLFSWIVLILLAPQLAKVAVSFGPIDLTTVIIFGLTTAISLSGKSLSKGVISAAFGLLVCAIGMDPIHGYPRMTLGTDFLGAGVNAIPAMIGLFVVSEIFSNLASPPAPIKNVSGLKQVFLTVREWKDSAGNFLRSGVIGAAIGILPGVGGALANFVAYDQAKKASARPETFGQGNIQGLIASETANNAVIGGALIPLLTLGIPGDTVTAALMSGLQLHGIDPGPLLFRDHPGLVYTVYAAFFTAAIFMFLTMAFLGARFFPLILRIPRVYVLPVVLVACTAGCYNINTSMVDVWVALAFGVIGYFFQRYGYPTTPAVIGLVLGGMLEVNLRKALLETDCSLLPFVSSPVPALFLALALFSLGYSLWQQRKSSLLAKAAD